MRRLLIFLMTTVLIVSISLFGSGCETVAETPEVTEEAVVETPEVIEEAIARTPFSELDGGGMTFGLYVNNLDNPYFADTAAGAERAAEELNVNLIGLKWVLMLWEHALLILQVHFLLSQNR